MKSTTLYFASMNSYKLLTVFLIFTLNFACVNKERSNPTPKAVRGILDLQSVSWDFEGKGDNDGVINLDGEWEFYWEEFLPPNNSEIKNSKLKYIQVPSQWQIGGFPSHGYATYRLKIILPETFENKEKLNENLKKIPLSISMTDAGTAYEMYINGKLASVNGKVGKSREEMQIFMKYDSFSIDPFLKNNEIEILFYVSNFLYFKAGLWDTIKLGSTKKIEKKAKQKFALDLIVFSSLMIMGLYHLGLFMNRRKDLSILYFGVYCLLIAIRTVLINERLILDVFPFIPFLIIHKIEYFTFYFGSYVFIQFFKYLFPSEFNKTWFKIFYIIFLASTGLVILAPFNIYTLSLNLVQITIVFAIFYSVYALINAARHSRVGAKLFLAGWILFASAIIHDIIKTAGFIYTPYLGSYGLLGFIIFQAAVLSRKFAGAFTESEKLAEELEQKSSRLEETSLELSKFAENLEAKVHERTRDLEEAKSEIEKLNKITKRINSVSSLTDVMTFIMYFLEKEYQFSDFWLLVKEDNQDYLHTFSYVSPGTQSHVQEYFKNFRIGLSEKSFITKTFSEQKILYLPIEDTLDLSLIDKTIIENGKFTFLLQIPFVIYSETIGILCIHKKSGKTISKELLDKLQNFSNQVAGAVFNSKLFKQVQDSKEQTEALNQLLKSLNENLDIKVIMKKVHKYIKENHNINYYGLAVVEEGGDRLCAIDSFSPEFISNENLEKINHFSTKIKNVVGGHAFAFKAKKPFYIPRARASGLTPEELFIYETTKFESLLIIPLILQNEPIGFLDLYNVGKMKLSEEEIVKLSILGEQLAGIIYGSNLFKAVQEERVKSDQLLLNILPEKVAKELKEKGHVDPVYFESASILFTDFKGFTQIAEGLSPEDLVKELDGCFTQFDQITERYKLEKLKTIGDSYMCAGGLPRVNSTHPIDACLAALEIQGFMNQMKEIKEMMGIPFWELRLGIHTGPLMAGVVGKKKFAYDVWGDTVNTASRMESSGTPGKINISEATYERVNNLFECEYRGELEAKNKGKVKMYYLLRIKSNFSRDKEGLVPNGKFWELYG